VRKRAVEIVGRQVSHMSRLLDDLIDIARITQRRLVLKPEWVPVQQLVDTAMEAAAPLAEAKRHVLSAHVAEPQRRVHADPVRLAQVLSNLLNNAVKYTDPGGRITLDVRSQGPWLVFSVTDSGIGMSAEALGNVFAMVELHGGTIHAYSAGPGAGSRFEVRLPEEKRAEDPPREHSGQAQAASSAGRVIVLADDNADAVEVLAELLRIEGHEVHVAHDGQAAADLAARVRPHVLVLDIGMPGLNGYEVARQVRAQDWGARALLVAATGWGQEEDRRKALAAGFDLHFTKPFAPEKLLSAIASLER